MREVLFFLFGSTRAHGMTGCIRTCLACNGTAVQQQGRKGHMPHAWPQHELASNILIHTAVLKMELHVTNVLKNATGAPARSKLRHSRVRGQRRGPPKQASQPSWQPQCAANLATKLHQVPLDIYQMTVMRAVQLCCTAAADSAGALAALTQSAFRFLACAQPLQPL